MHHLVHVALILFEHGKGRGVVLLAVLAGSFLSLVITPQAVNSAYQDPQYYTEHAWPKSLGLGIPGLACTVAGLALFPSHRRARGECGPAWPAGAARGHLAFDEGLRRYFDLVLLGLGSLMLL